MELGVPASRERGAAGGAEGLPRVDTGRPARLQHLRGSGRTLRRETRAITLLPGVLQPPPHKSPNCFLKH